jgi:hypothetical protein
MAVSWLAACATAAAVTTTVVIKTDNLPDILFSFVPCASNRRDTSTSRVQLL